MDQLTITPHLQCCALLRNLALTDKRIAKSQSLLARQREIVAELERAGNDCVSARHTLARFETVHALRIADRERLVEFLSKG